MRARGLGEDGTFRRVDSLSAGVRNATQATDQAERPDVPSSRRG